MIEIIQTYLVPIALFFLLFFAVTLLFDRFNKKGKLYSRLKKIPWNTGTVIKTFFVWAAILAARKAVYYISLTRIVQTKDSLVWMDEMILFALFAGLFFYPLLVLTLLFIKKMINKGPPEEGEQVQNAEGGCSQFPVIFGIWAPFAMVLAAILKGVQEITFQKILVLLIFQPLLLLKMVSSGKYLGLLTALLFAYYIINRHREYKKIETAEIAVKVKFSILPVFIIIVILISGYFRFTGNCQAAFQRKARTVKSTRAYEDVIDAANTISDQNRKSRILKEIFVSFAHAGKMKWSKDFFQRAVETTGAIENENDKFDAVVEIGAAIAKTGDIVGMSHCLETIKNKTVKLAALMEIAAEVSRTGNREILKKVIYRWLDLAATIEDKENKPLLLSDIAIFAAKTGNKKWSQEIFQRALDMAGQAADEKTRALAFLQIAAAAAKTGDREGVRKILRQCDDTAGKIAYDFQKAEVSRKIAEAVAATGDLKWAKTLFQRSAAAAQRINVAFLKSRELIKIAAGIAKIGETQWAKEVLQKALDAVDGIERQWMKAAVLKDIGAEILGTGDKKWATKVLQRALNAAGTIEDRLNRSNVLKGIALEIAKTGDKKQAVSIAGRIPLRWIKNDTLKEITKI